MLIVRRNSESGLSLLELMICCVIIGVFSATALPLSKNFVKSKKEDALNERLSEMRKAIDKYCEKMKLAKPGLSEKDCYPEKLEDMVNARVIRRIPVDPMTSRSDWRTISFTDLPDAPVSDGYNVYDIRSISTDTAFNGSKYSSW
ncbi:MAG: type II secretion system protein [Candidatus Riflebacteria bacterium]|nr:type II secretion system protein [Candidatus Riflebacteria bacterium]